MRKITLLMVFFAFAWSYGQGLETFENATNLPSGGSYEDGSFEGEDGVTWNYVHCRDVGDFEIDGAGIMLRRASDPSSLSATISGGIGDFSVDTRKAFTGNAQRILELYINDVLIDTFEPAFGDGADDTVIAFTVNDINVEGEFDLEIRVGGTGTTNRQIVLDNLSWTGYTTGGGTDPEYCEPELDCTDGDLITNVTFAGIDNDSACGTNGYSDFTESVSPAEVTAGETYLFSATVGDGWINESVSVWIDYNNDGIFDEDEFTFIGTGSNETLSANITINADAEEGEYRMRVRLAAVPGGSATWDMSCDEDDEFGETEDYLVSITVAEPVLARVQVIHNSADPIAEFVDVYLDDVLLLEDFEFRTSTPFVDIPAGVPVSIDVAPAGSTSSADSVYNLTATLDEGETYLVIATGVLDPSQFDESVNSPIDFRLEVYAGAREVALDPAETDLLVHHGSTDAPTVDVVETSVPVGIIVDDITFPEFQGYLELVPGDYEIDITNADGTVIVASYGVPLSTLNLDGAALTVLASGFLDPSVNQDGAAFGLWVSLASGGALVELPLLGGIPNEECDDAIALTCGDVVTGTTVGASNTGGNIAGDVFFTYTGSGEAELVTISLCDGGTTFDSLLRVYSDCTLTEQIAINDDFCGLQSQLTFESDGVSTYIIMVEGFGASEGEFSLAITCELPPPPPACGGIFTDTGGVDGDYSNGEDVVWTITPDEADDFVTVIFTEFDVEANWDALYVYDGPDTSSPLISSGNPPTTSGFPAGGFYGTTIPGPFASTHPTGALTFRFLSDGSVTRPGWVADIVCAPVPPPNDLIENAISVTAEAQPYVDPAVRLQFATNELLNPDGCAIAGTNGVWYSFTASAEGTVDASIITPAGASAVIFYEAPSEDVGDETDLTFIFELSNQCGPGTDASITTVAGQSYYIFVLNTGGPSDVRIDISNALSTNDNTIDGFSFYPNPTMDVLNLRSNISIDSVELFNMLGQRVISQVIGATTSQIDVSGLAIGTYVMRVSTEGQTATYQVIKK